MAFKIPFFQVSRKPSDNIELFKWLKTYFSRASSTDLVLSRVIDIGDWDMDTAASLNVDYKSALGALSLKRVVGLNIMIMNDDEDTFYDASLIKDGLDSVNIDATDITLVRTAGGFFDNVNFNSTSITTRGKIEIKYTT